MNTRIKKVVKIIGSDKRVLDLGCVGHLRDVESGVFPSTFYIASILKENGNQVTGIDCADIENPPIKYIKFDLTKLSKLQLPLENNSFDIVYAGELIEHIIDVKPLFREIRRVLRNSGFFILTIPNIASLLNRFLLLIGKPPRWCATTEQYIYLLGKKIGLPTNSEHVKDFTMETIIDLLKRHKFRVEKVIGTRVFPFFGGDTSPTFSPQYQLISL